jgi:Glycosyltransferase family 87
MSEGSVTAGSTATGGGIGGRDGPPTEVAAATASPAVEPADSGFSRRLAIHRRAIRRDWSRLHDRRRLLAMALLIVTFGFLAAGIVGRGEPAGADARAYWAGVRIWLNGGDPYHPTGPFLPYVYAPWMLPLFAPWALLPWDVAWYVWRGGTILLLLWTIHWAYRQRPLETAILVALLGFPFGANLDTGNINLLLTLMLWGAQFSGPVIAGFLWSIATWMKWAPVLLLPILAPRARLWGLVFLGMSALLSVATLPATIQQLNALFGFGARPLRLDYLVFLWALVPVLWRRREPFAWLRPATWRAAAGRLRQGSPAGLGRRLRDYLGLGVS